MILLVIYTIMVLLTAIRFCFLYINYLLEVQLIDFSCSFYYRKQMYDIKTKDMKPKTIKIIDKVVAWTKKVKDPVAYINEKVKDTNDY